MHSRFVSGLAALSTVAALHGAPAIRTTASVRLLEDTNLYLQNPAPLAAGQSRPALPARESVVAADAAVMINGAWHLGGAKLEFGYAPEVLRYFDHGSEDHTDHVFTAAAASQSGAWTSEFKARYLYTAGSHEAPIYNGLGGSPAIGGEPVRARRAQAIGRANGKIVHALGAGFARGVFSLYDQNFRTTERTTPGYCNYADRNESSAGIDTGWRTGKKFALVTGARVGFQRQSNLLGVASNYSNTFTRWLAGVEGAVSPTIRLSLLAGPDIRRYGRSVRAGFARYQRTGYGEGTGSWTPTSTDIFALSAKHYLWLPAGGRGTYVDTVVDLSWKRSLTATWAGTASANFHDGNTGRFNPTVPRHDHIYTGALGLSRSFPNRTHLDFDMLHDRGVSLLSDTPSRAYSRWIGSVSVGRSW
jgi:hypothetical protein